MFWFPAFKSHQKPLGIILFPFFASSPLSYWCTSESSPYIGRYWSFWRHLFNNSVVGGDKKWWKHVICRRKWRNCRFIGRHFPSNEWQQHLEQSPPCFSPLVFMIILIVKLLQYYQKRLFQSFSLIGRMTLFSEHVLLLVGLKLYLVDIMFQCMVGFTLCSATTEKADVKQLNWFAWRGGQHRQ